MSGQKKAVLLLPMIVILVTACGQKPDIPAKESPSSPSDAVSLLGEPLNSPEPTQALLDKLAQRKQDFESDPNNADALIWYGRFIAYSGDYRRAINLFSKGIELFPDDPRMLRHRAHRYISIRKFGKAIEDLERAVGLIADKPNEIEPDGMPNALNIPVSTLHGNIWYHLGLAYYLKHDFENALRCYQSCLATANRPDNVVSATHWIYMIHRRMNNEEAARNCLASISSEMEVIENISYWKCCQFYKGLITLEQLKQATEDESQRAAVDYAIGNWHFYNGERDRALASFKNLTGTAAWNSFGFIAAESELAANESGD